MLQVVIGLGSKPLDDTSEWFQLSGHREEKTTHFSTEITTLSPTGSRISDEELSDYDEKFLAHTGNSMKLFAWRMQWNKIINTEINEVLTHAIFFSLFIIKFLTKLGLTTEQNMLAGEHISLICQPR